MRENIELVQKDKLVFRKGESEPYSGLHREYFPKYRLFGPASKRVKYENEYLAGRLKRSTAFYWSGQRRNEVIFLENGGNQYSKWHKDGSVDHTPDIQHR